VSEYHWGRLNEAQAETIAELYFLLDGDRKRIGEAIGLGRILDVQYLTHILVRRRIAAKVRQMRKDRVYTREEHILQLQKIRDACLADENYKVALSAEVAVGKAAGLYENIGPGDDESALASTKPAEQLSTDEIRAKLRRIQGQRDLPAPSQVIVENEPLNDDDEAF
jgi:hypothetical protein